MISPAFTKRDIENTINRIDKLINFSLQNMLDDITHHEIIDHHHDLLIREEFKSTILSSEKNVFVIKFQIPMKENSFELFINVERGMMGTMYISRFHMTFDIGYLDFSNLYKPILGHIDKERYEFTTSRKKYDEILNNDNFIKKIVSNHILYTSNSKNISISEERFLTMIENSLMFSFPLEVDHNELLELNLFDKIKVINILLKRIIQLLDGSH